MGHRRSPSQPQLPTEEVPVLWDFALLFAVGTVCWGLFLVPINAYSEHHVRSLFLGFTLLGLSLLACHKSDWLYQRTLHFPYLVWVITIIAVTALWADGGWRSTFYLASYSGIAVAVVATNQRFTFSCAALLAIGYVLGLVANGYTWSELQTLRDADSVVANAGGYFLVAVFVGVPLETVKQTGRHPLRGPDFWTDFGKRFVANVGASLVVAAAVAALYSSS